VTQSPSNPKPDLKRLDRIAAQKVPTGNKQSNG
jgi:hypothetical protein